MQSLKANKLIETLIEDSEKEFNPENVVEKLKEVRVIAKQEQDPAIVKILRLCYEYIEENENFDIAFLEEEEAGGLNDFTYLMQLIIQSHKEANRAEIREIRDLLMKELYG